jgi:hypothetical protein
MGREVDRARAARLSARTRRSPESVMKKQVYLEPEAEQILPLLVSIGRELKNRMRSIDEIEEKLAKSRPSTSANDEEKQKNVAELAVHKRELRKTLKELEQLGCKLDADHPLRILIPGLNGPMAFEGSLDKTMFRFRPFTDNKK